MLHRVILSEQAHKIAADHLLSHYDESGRGDEDLCFAIWRPSTGAETYTALIDEIVLPKSNERNLHGNVSFESRFLQRAVNHAYDQNAGLAFMHSHPCNGWQGMSADDIYAEQIVIAPRAKSLGLPLVGMTIGTDGAWSARFWERESRTMMKKHECERVNVTGGQLRATFHPDIIPPFEWREEFQRTASAWGMDAQSTLGRIRFGIVGLGSVGCIVAESLARMGVQHITLIDPDKVEKHNLDRLIYATCENIGELKVDFFAKQLRKSATAKAEMFTVRPIPHEVNKSPGFKAALDCDILFCCVDTHYGRYMLNHIAYAHMIPVFEGGIDAAPRNGKIARPRWQTHAVYPGIRCLLCHQQYDHKGLCAELSGNRNNPSYTGPKQEEMPNENVFVFSTHLASTQVLQMLRHVVTDGWSVKPHTDFSFRANRLMTQPPDSCKQGCHFPDMKAKGNQATDHLVRPPS